MATGMIKYHILTLLRDPGNMFFAFGLPFLYLFLFSGNLDGDNLQFFLDRALPMFITIAAMMLCFTCAGLSHAYSRQIKFLRRLRMTPVKPATYIFTGIISRIGVLFIFSVAFIAVTSLGFDLNMRGRNWPAFIGVLVLAFAMFYLMAMFAANVLRNSKTSQGVLYVVFFGLLLFGDVFFPINAMPDIIQPVVQNMPTIHARNVLQAAWLDTDLLYGHSLITIIGLIVVFGLLSIICFRYE